MTPMKSFADVWQDVQDILKPGLRIQTLCQKSVNTVIEVSPDKISVSSSRSKNQKVRLITKDDFEYVWKILSTEGIYTLHGLPKIIGRRSITCAIIARLPYVIGECHDGRVSLKLKK